MCHLWEHSFPPKKNKTTKNKKNKPKNKQTKNKQINLKTIGICEVFFLMTVPKKIKIKIWAHEK